MVVSVMTDAWELPITFNSVDATKGAVGLTPIQYYLLSAPLAPGLPSESGTLPFGGHWGGLQSALLA